MFLDSIMLFVNSSPNWLRRVCQHEIKRSTYINPARVYRYNNNKSESNVSSRTIAHRQQQNGSPRNSTPPQFYFLFPFSSSYTLFATNSIYSLWRMMAMLYCICTYWKKNIKAWRCCGRVSHTQTNLYTKSIRRLQSLAEMINRIWLHFKLPSLFKKNSTIFPFFMGFFFCIYFQSDLCI